MVDVSEKTKWYLATFVKNGSGEPEQKLPIKSNDLLSAAAAAQQLCPGMHELIRVEVVE